MRAWQQLLGERWEGVQDEYGPHSQAVVSAFEALRGISWFNHVGEALPPEVDGEFVSSWDAAIGALRRNEGGVYGPNGHLLAPSERCIAIIESARYRPWWIKARDAAYEAFGTSEALDPAWDQGRSNFVSEYVYEFVSFLLAEIIGADEVGSTYFRELLAWFEAGRFPAGWVGAWPAGRRRVF